jgi:hypothetical protein
MKNSRRDCSIENHNLKGDGKPIVRLAIYIKLAGLVLDLLISGDRVTDVVVSEGRVAVFLISGGRVSEGYVIVFLPVRGFRSIFGFLSRFGVLSISPMRMSSARMSLGGCPPLRA